MKLKYLAILFWLCFTISLSVWLYVFSFSKMEELAAAIPSQAAEVLRYQRMLVWEASFLVAFILGGAGFLTYFVFRDIKRMQSIRDFFLTFAHEIKTPITSLQLRVEGIQDRYKDSELADLIGGVLKDLSRLTLQLENSLLLAETGARKDFVEEVDLSECLKFASNYYPELTVNCNKAALLIADSRALHAIFRNIFHNALKHGKAKSIFIELAELELGKLELCIRDDGIGFKGDHSKLGFGLSRHYAGSGSGVGLYLVRRLIKRLGGRLEILPSSVGFQLKLVLKGRLL